jgi:hypothetical protein
MLAPIILAKLDGTRCACVMPFPACPFHAFPLMLQMEPSAPPPPEEKPPQYADAVTGGFGPAQPYASQPVFVFSLLC